GYTSCVFFCICDIFCFSIFSSLIVLFCVSFFFFFFFNDTATSEIYTLSLHDALPIYPSFADGYALMASVKTFAGQPAATLPLMRDRKSTRLNSSHLGISYAVFCLKKKNEKQIEQSQHINKNNVQPTQQIYLFTTFID